MTAAAAERPDEDPELAETGRGRGLHSFTFQLNLSRV
jgi:hypothetical protein